MGVSRTPILLPFKVNSADFKKDLEYPEKSSS